MVENYEYSLPKTEKQNARTSQEVVEEAEAVVVGDAIVTDPDLAGGHGPGHVTEGGQDLGPGDPEIDQGTGEGPGLHVIDLAP